MAKTKVKRRNRVLTIDKFEVESYLEQGYDEIDTKTGEVVKKATGGRTVSLAEYNKVVDELDELKGTDINAVIAENEKLKKEIKRVDLERLEEIEILKKENAALKGQLTKLQNAKEKEDKK